MDKLIKEVGLVGCLAQLCLGNFPDDQRKKLMDIFCLRDDLSVGCFNLWIKRTIDELKNGSLSVESFGFQHIECLSDLFNSDKLDKNLMEELEKLLEKKCEEEARIRKKQSEKFERDEKIKALLSDH